jgi:hypothetical protein
VGVVTEEEYHRNFFAFRVLSGPPILVGKIHGFTADTFHAAGGRGFVISAAAMQLCFCDEMFQSGRLSLCGEYLFKEDDVIPTDVSWQELMGQENDAEMEWEW